MKTRQDYIYIKKKKNKKNKKKKKSETLSQEEQCRIRTNVRRRIQITEKNTKHRHQGKKNGTTSVLKITKIIINKTDNFQESIR